MTESNSLTFAGLLGLHRGSRRPAILAPGRLALSHAELGNFLDSTLDALGEMGITREHRVATVLPNGPEAATSFLAIGSCAGFAPLNPLYTQRDFEFYLDDLKADALLTSAAVSSPAVAAAEARGVPLIRLEIEPDMPAGLFRLAAERKIGPPRAAQGTAAQCAAALLLHTSGTTSRPKLVPLLESNLCASAINISQTLQLAPEDRCLNIMPLFHIHGLMAALLASISAGAAVVCTDGVYGTQFVDWLEEFQPTWYTAVPTMHQAILSRAASRLETVRSVRLRFLRSSSAALAPQVLEQMEQAFEAPLLEAYGMTEAAHQMASNPLPPLARKPGAVGPAAGPEIAVMNDSGELLPAGSVGEVVIRGANVTPGYESNPEANRAAFTNGWFRTGDQGYLDNDGYLHLAGRLKELINRGGEKISPREVDEALLAHPAVKQALSFAVPHAQLGEEVAVAVELKPGEAASESELRRFAAGRLPAFKVPKLVKVLDEIPKGPTGKLQRIGLAEKLGVAPMDDTAGRAAYVEPRDETERQVAAIWREVLGAPQVGALDTFESLGGDSLLMVRVIAEANQSLGLDVPFVQFLEERTVEAMANEIRRAMANPDTACEMVPVRIEGAGAPLYCVPGHDGVLLGIRRLSELLKEVPVWAFPLRAGTEEARIPVLGQRMADSVNRLQPEGPIRLAGVCFGGLVAYETACRLHAQGRDVEVLVMIDTLNPGWRRSLGPIATASAFARMSLKRLRPHLTRLASMDWIERGSYIGSRCRAFGDLFSQRALVYRRAQAVYTPTQRYPGKTLLFEMQARRLRAPMLGWQGLVAEDTVIMSLPFDTTGSLSAVTAPVVARAVADELSNRNQHA